MNELKIAKILKHTMILEYVCEKNKTKITSIIENPEISDGQYYEDWHYKYIKIKCESCGELHKFEI